MEKKVKITFQGKQVEGVEVEFKPKKEEWNEYEINDGSTIRIKLVVTNVLKINEYDPEGNPVYLTKSTNVVSVSAPDNLKKGSTLS